MDPGPEGQARRQLHQWDTWREPSTPEADGEGPGSAEEPGPAQQCIATQTHTDQGARVVLQKQVGPSGGYATLLPVLSFLCCS